MNDGKQPAESQSHCTSCGVPWASHMGIVGTCAEKAQLRNERDEARRMYCEMASPVCGSKYTGPNSVAKDKGWDCYKSEETK